MAVAVVDREGTETFRPSRVPEPEQPAPGRWDDVTHRRVRWLFALAAVLVVALVVSLIVRPIGSYVTAVDGWGVDAFELLIGVLCLARYFEGSWRMGSPTARLFPLVMGVACVSWALGDVALTIESLGGASPSTPSVADAFYVGFFPVCFLAFALLIRRGNKSSLVSTSLDGLIAGLGVAAVSAAFVVAAVIRITGGGALAAATNLAYPLGDVLLLALAVGGCWCCPVDSACSSPWRASRSSPMPSATASTCFSPRADSATSATAQPGPSPSPSSLSPSGSSLRTSKSRGPTGSRGLPCPRSARASAWPSCSSPVSGTSAARPSPWRP